MQPVDSFQYSHTDLCVALKRSSVNVSFLYKSSHVTEALVEAKNHHHKLANISDYEHPVFPFISISIFFVSTALFDALTALHPSLLPPFPNSHD